MKVRFKTNIDAYQNSHFPRNFEIPPRIGDSISLPETLFSYYRSKRLPTTLKVVDVTWYENEVVCELWYSKIDIEAAELSGTKLF